MKGARVAVVGEFMETTEVAAVLAGLYGLALANPTVGVERIVLRSPSDIA